MQSVCLCVKSTSTRCGCWGSNLRSRTAWLSWATRRSVRGTFICLSLCFPEHPGYYKIVTGHTEVGEMSYCLSVCLCVSLSEVHVYTITYICGCWSSNLSSGLGNSVVTGNCILETGEKLVCFDCLFVSPPCHALPCSAHLFLCVLLGLKRIIVLSVVLLNSCSQPLWVESNFIA